MYSIDFNNNNNTSFYHNAYSTSIADSINSTMTPAEFDKECKAYSNVLRLNLGERDGFSFLTAAANCGNLSLIEHIVNIARTSIDSLGITPLYCTLNCDNSENGLLSAKKMIRLDIPLSHLGESFLTKALAQGKNKIVTLCLRMGLIPSQNDLECYQKELSSAKKEIMTKNEKLFVMHNRETTIPNDIIRYILTISAKLV